MKHIIPRRQALQTAALQKPYGILPLSKPISFGKRGMPAEQDNPNGRIGI